MIFSYTELFYEEFVYISIVHVYNQSYVNINPILYC